MKHVILSVILLALVWIVYTQGNTIEQQRTLIRQMAQNPQCLVPPQ